MENLPKALLYGGSMTGNFPAGKEYDGYSANLSAK